MLKLIATRDENIDERTDARRRSNHLTSGWLPNQSWKLKGVVAGVVAWEGDAQLVVRGRDEDCAAVIRIGNVIDVVLCSGVVQGLERLGFLRADIEVG